MASAVTEFLRLKWRNVFRLIDTNKDGLLTVDDYILIADRISQRTGATPEQTEKTRKEWSKYFSFYQPDPSVKVDEIRYVQSYEEMCKDIKSFKDMKLCTGNDLFDRLDFNGDGFISLDEFAIYYEAMDITEKNVIDRHFQNIDHNGDGLIQRKEFLDEVVRYFCDPNPETGRSYLLPLSQD